MRQRFVTNRSALMVESVDTRDLKSLGPKGRAGSTPAWGTMKQRQSIDYQIGWHCCIYQVPVFGHVFGHIDLLFDQITPYLLALVCTCVSFDAKRKQVPGHRGRTLAANLNAVLRTTRAQI